MATITSTASGNATAGATWVGGVAPGSGDRAVIAAGHVVTVDSAVTWDSFEVAATGSLVIAAGGTLTFAASSKLNSAAGGTGDRVRVEAGGTLACNPPVSTTATLQLGSDGAYYQNSLLRLAGTDDANRATLRKTAGALGSFVVSRAGTTLSGECFISDWGHINTVNSFNLRTYVAGVFALRNTTLHDVLSFEIRYAAGAHAYIEDCWFTHSDAASNPPFMLYCADATSRAPGYSTLKRNRFGITELYVLDLAGAAPTNMAGLDSDLNIFEGRTNFSADVCHRRSLFYLRPAQHEPGPYGLNRLGSETYNVDNAYCVGDFNGDPGGNCHYFISTGSDTFPAGINDVVFDYIGIYGTDNGDALDLTSVAGRTARVHNALILPSTPTDANPPITSGNIWSLVLGAEMSRLDIDHLTMYTRGWNSGIGLVHDAGYSGAGDRVTLKNSLFWGSSATKDAVVSFVDTDVMTVDVLKASSVTDNAMWNAGTFTNTVGGSSTPAKGFYGQKVTALPTLLDLDASGGPNFVDGSRGFVRWCREVRGHNSGTLATDMAAGLADIKADPTLTFSSLKPWVRAGYAPRNALLDAAGDGTWIGAVEGAAPASSFQSRVMTHQRFLMGGVL